MRMRNYGLWLGVLLLGACVNSSGTTGGTLKAGDSGAADAGVKDSGATDVTTKDAGAPDIISGSDPKIQITTSMGAFIIQLNPAKAPKTVANFLVYVKEGFFDGSDGGEATVFHRVIKGFTVQGGGLTAAMQKKGTHPPIDLESQNGLKNLRGTVAMARTNVPNSATSQFFVNHVDNGFLDYGTKPPGYAVFGEVIEGMSVVDAIAAVKTGGKSGMKDVPLETITIKSVKKL